MSAPYEERTSPLKRLIVTADDVGMHPAMTDGAIHAHRQGIVTACSIVVGGVDFERAAELLRGERALDVGVHLQLVEGKPLSDPSTIASLVSGKAFRPAWPSFARAWLQGSVRRVEVERELRAQVERALARDLHLTHLNSHQHLHLLPGIFAIVERMAVDYGIHYLRIANDRGGVARLGRRLAIGLLGRLGRIAARRNRIASNERTLGIANAGALDEATLIKLLDRVRGVTELVTHPAVESEDLARAYPWGYAWSRELEGLCSPRLREAMAVRDIELIAPRSV